MPKQQERKRQQSPVIKIPTTLLTASPQQALLSFQDLDATRRLRECMLASDKRLALRWKRALNTVCRRQLGRQNVQSKATVISWLDGSITILHYFRWRYKVENPLSIYTHVCAYSIFLYIYIFRSTRWWQTFPAELDTWQTKTWPLCPHLHVYPRLHALLDH